jgi:hypothetical protein
MTTRTEYQVLRTSDAEAPTTAFAKGVFSINDDTQRIHVYDGAAGTLGGIPSAKLADLNDLSLLNYPAGSLIANTAGIAGAPAYVTIASLGSGPSAAEPLIDPLASVAYADSYSGSTAFVTMSSGGAGSLIGANDNRGGRTSWSTGGTANGRTSRGTSMSGGSIFVFSAASGVHTYKMLGWSTPVLSDATDTFAQRFGFGDSITGDFTDGAYFEFEANANANILYKTAAAGVRTTVTTTFAPAAGTDYDFKVVVTQNSSADFYYRISSSQGAWTLLGTTTTNIPSGTTRATSCGLSIIKSAGTTSRSMEIQNQVAFQVTN